MGRHAVEVASDADLALRIARRKDKARLLGLDIRCSQSRELVKYSSVYAYKSRLEGTIEEPYQAFLKHTKVDVIMIGPDDAPKCDVCLVSCSIDEDELTVNTSYMLKKTEQFNKYKTLQDMIDAIIEDGEEASFDLFRRILNSACFDEEMDTPYTGSGIRLSKRYMLDIDNRLCAQPVLSIGSLTFFPHQAVANGKIRKDFIKKIRAENHTNVPEIRGRAINGIFIDEMSFTNIERPRG